ncbi:alpha/beta-hydrolase [Gloeopeniophorella convolvens]|nr:alpha/beta-hydrolase [Gloeopeniophorella convolvens]
MRLGILLVSLFPLLVTASPLLDRADDSTSDGQPTPVSTQDISDNFVRPAQFARIAYCSSDAIQKWDCGEPCQVLEMDHFTPLAVGGDGGKTPRFFVGYDNKTASIVVAHQGTDSSNILSVINDAEFILSGINTTLFPKASSDVKVHDGFSETHGRSADVVLSTVRSALQTTGAQKVAVTGHSLGAAIATMDALMLRQNLDPGVAINTVVFGLPRGGNAAYADLVDAELGGQFTFVTHGNDPVPVVPPRFVGYQHPSGEVHIPPGPTGEANTVECPGQENQHCQDGNSLLDTSIDDHLGPYFANVSMGESFCPL